VTADVLYMRAEDVLARSYGDEVLLAAPRRDVVDQLKGPAADVWEVLDRPRTIEDVVEQLTRLYRAPVERVQDDVQKLLDELVDRGWVQAVSDGDD
jgi:hypothetical protein